MKKLFAILILCFLCKSNNVYCQQILLSENFESGILNPMMTIQTVGTFNSNPGIKNTTSFGSTKAFGFGVSTCPSSCFNNFTSTLTITFPSPTFVDSIKWSEMELFGNWGSQGQIYLDGVVLSTSDIGALPPNSGTPDAFPRYQAYSINQTVTVISLLVADITNASEITIDDLQITRPQPVITSFAPSSGAIGSSVTITGTGFNTTASQNIVFFGATQATVTAATATSLTVTVPLGATYQFLSVTNLAVNLTAYSTKPFIVNLAGSTNFLPKVDFTTGTTPWSVSIGDIDGDGKPDLAVANQSNNTISVLRNTSTSGTTNFATKVDFATGTNPRSVTMGDIDGDGKPDLVMANDGSSNVSVMRNNSTSGTVSFLPKVDFATGVNPYSVSIGDIDGDGKPDLVSANLTGNTVSVLRNTSTSGTVSFATKVDFAAGTTSRSVSVGDIDGDGKPDLAVANYGSNTVSVLRNTSTSGAVSFATKVDFATGTNPISVSIGDIDGDGKPDLAVANYGSNTVSVLRNTSSGTVTFLPKVDFATGTNPYSVSIGDIDGDGKPDLAVANSGSITVSLLRNTSTSGTVSFATKVDFATGTNPASVSIGDIDGDGKPDLAVANSGSNTVSVIRQAGSSVNILSFAPATGAIGSSVTITGSGFNTTAAQNIVFFGATQATVTAATATSLTVTVPSGATYQYLSVTNLAVNQSAYSAKPFIVTLAGSTNFLPKVDFTTGTNPWSVSIGDIDGDGKPDLALTNYSNNTVSVLRNTSTSGTVSFAAKVDFATGTNPRSVSIGDLDGDGKPDLAVANDGSYNVSVLRNTSTPGSVSFAPKVEPGSGGYSYSISIGDLDGDGKPDLVVVNSIVNRVEVFRNTSTPGTMSFANRVEFVPVSGPYSVSIGDIDGDGKPDLAVANSSSQTVSVFRNTSTPGTVNFAYSANLATGTNPSSVCLGDVDGDGKPDLAVANSGSSTVSVLLNTSTSGTASFAAKVDFATGTSPNSVSIGDIDGDGKPDLAVANYGSGNVSVCNTSTSGTVSFAAKVGFATGTKPYSVSIGDIDGDCRPDMALANYSSATVSVIRQAGSSVNILSFAPATGAIGSSVTITGMGFNTNAAQNIVFFGATKATVTAATATSLTVTVPLGATYQFLSVTNLAINLTAYSSKPFIVRLTGSTAFESKVDFTTSTTPYLVTIGDIDGDGKTDLAVANQSNNTVSILRNTSTSGTTNFATKVDFATGTGPVSISIGDIDGDGKPDMAVANSASNTLSVLRNTSASGTVSFAAKVDFATGLDPVSVSIGDIDGDGKPDLAVANDSGNTVSVFRNTSISGTTSFASKIDFATGTRPVSVSIGDIDNDGKPDLAVANYGNNKVSVFRNTSATGTVSFAPKVDFTTGANPESVSIGDIDGDGKPDMAVANYGSASVSVLRNISTSGTVSFAAKVNFATGTSPCSVSIGDLDGDGKPDMAVASSNSGTVSVIRQSPPNIPIITNFAPASGAIGSSVTITGTGFNTTLAQNIVFFGATQATVTAATATSLTVTVPLGATYQYLSVTSLAVNKTAYSAKPFIVTLSGNINAFVPKVDFAIGTGSWSVSLGDIDGDGKADLAAANLYGSTVSVFRNTSITGATSYAAKVDFATGTNPVSISIGDIDGDGKPDLAVANYVSDTVSLFRNISSSGTVSFAPKVDFATGESPISVSMGDIDGDGKPDLAVANNDGNSVSVLRNTSTSGTVSFAAKVDFATGDSPQSVSIGDIDGDGKPDLAVANQSNTVSVLRNTSTSGTLSFAVKVDFATGATPYSLSIGDIDGDGYPDLAVANFAGNNISVLRNTSTSGTTSFAAKVDFATGSGPRSVSIGDIDGDGKPDLAVANYYNSNVSLLRNTSSSGTVSFAVKADFATVDHPASVGIGDTDGDGKPDLAAACESYTPAVSVIRQINPIIITAFAPASGTIGSSVTISGTGFNTTAAQNIVYFGATKAVVTSASATSLTVTVPLGATYQYLSVTNLVSVLTAYSAKPFIVTLAGSTTFLPKVDFASGTQPYSVSIGDIDGDGKPDLAVANINSNSISVLRNTSTPGTVSFATKVDFTTGTSPFSVIIGDIDGYGKPDLVVTNNGSNSVSVLLNTSTLGTVNFATKVDLATGSGPLSVSIGDLDGDGKPDLAVVNNNYFNSSLSVLRNTSTFEAVSFSAKVDYATGVGIRSVIIGDIDGDGKPDLAVANYGSSTVSVLRNTSTLGATNFATKVDFATGSGPLSVSIGDIDGDGKPDLAVACQGSNTISVFRSTSTSGTVSFATKVDFVTGTEPVSVSIGDIDGDGKPDLAVANSVSNTVSVIRQGGLSCIAPTVPILSASATTNCGSVSTTLSIASGTLNNAASWQWYSGSCGGTSVGTGTSVIVSPAATTTYFARGEGGCVTPGSCSSITITVIKPKPIGLVSSNITASSAITKWDTVACAVGYKLQYRKQGVTTWTTANITTNNPTKTISGLLAATTYQWRVSSKFADGTFSTYSAIVSFTTLVLRNGMETIESNNELVVYPNPADDKLNLEFPFTEGDVIITVVNSLGQTVLTQNVTAVDEAIQLNIENLSEGLYFINVQNGEHTFGSRFIKK